MFQQYKRIKYIKEIALPECRNGNLNFLGAIQWIFTFPYEKRLQIETACLNEKILSDIPVKKLIWLSENFRNWHEDYSVFSRTDQKIVLNKKDFLHLNEAQYASMLKLGTFMSNGYYRQWCMEQLSDTEGSLSFFILRMNDWVLPIRESAFSMAAQRLQKCSMHEIFHALLMLEKVKNSGRRNAESLYSLERQMETMIGQKFSWINDKELDEIQSYETAVRNSIYHFANQYKVLKQNQMDRLMQLEKTSYGKTLLILGMLRHYGCDKIKVQEYLASKSVVVRYHTLLYWYEKEQDAWEGLEKLLLDKSQKIRENVSYILVKRRGMDVAEYYRQTLERQMSKAALMGLGESGTKKDIEILLPVLNDTDEQICKTALTAYGKIAMQSGDKIYWKYLFDERKVMARRAFYLIRKYDVRYDVKCLYETFQQKRGMYSEKFLFDLLVCRPIWARLLYLLKLYFDESIPLEWRSMIIIAGEPYRNLYAKISKKEAQEICDILEHNKDKVSQDVREEILFNLKYITHS